jgi:hypothetical protein
MAEILRLAGPSVVLLDEEGVSGSDPQFGYATGYDQVTGTYAGLVFGSLAPLTLSSQGLLVRRSVAAAQVTTGEAAPVTVEAGGGETAPTSKGPGEQPSSPRRPHRFFGSVEIDAQGPIKAFEAVILNVI